MKQKRLKATSTLMQLTWVIPTTIYGEKLWSVQFRLAQVGPEAQSSIFTFVGLLITEKYNQPLKFHYHFNVMKTLVGSNPTCAGGTGSAFWSFTFVDF
jgi:hypothetical protein